MQKSKIVRSYTLLVETEKKLRKHCSDKATSMSAFVDVAIQEKIERDKK